MSEPELIVALDPGGTTGLAWWTRSSPSAPLGIDQIPNCNEDGLREVIELVEGLYDAYRPALVIYENFEFRKDETYRDKIDYTAAEVIGALRLWSADALRATLVKTSASLGKGFWTDDKIKKLGLWVPGKKHAMDALRHLLRYRAFDLGHRHLFEPLKPKE